MTTSSSPSNFFDFLQEGVIGELRGLKEKLYKNEIILKQYNKNPFKYEENQLNLLKLWSLILQGRSDDAAKKIEDFPIAKNIRLRYAQKIYKAIGKLDSSHTIMPSLVGAHLRSSNIAKGRMTAALDSGKYPSCDIIWELHTELLHVYFEIYGRSRTFNEFVFNRLSEEEKISSACLTVEFSSEDQLDTPFIKITQNPEIKPTGDNLERNSGIERTTIQLSHKFRNRLLPADLLDEFFRPVNQLEVSNYKVLLSQWYPKLCTLPKAGEPNLIGRMAECVEDTYCYYTSNLDDVEDSWRKLLEFLSPRLAVEHVHDYHAPRFWDKRTRSKAKGIIKSLQGICLYQYFASGSITTIAMEDRDKIGTAKGITLGFKSSPKSLDRSLILDHLIELFLEEDFPMFIPYERKDESSVTEQQSFHVWNELKYIDYDQKKLHPKYKENQPVLDKLMIYYEQLHPLCFSVHEGIKLAFTAYIGDQTALSKFRCLHEFKPKDIEYLIQDKAGLIKSHYSLFLDGRTGIFFDKSNEQAALVRPLAFNQLRDEQLLNLEEDEPGQRALEKREFFESLSQECGNMVIMLISEGEILVYFSGHCILEYSKRTNFGLHFLGWEGMAKSASSSKSLEWNVRSINELLLDKVFRNLPAELEHYKNSSAMTLATTVCRVSDTQGYGGMLVFYPNSLKMGIDKMKLDLNDSKLVYWHERPLYSCSSESLLSMMIPDGSCLVNLDTLTLENQVYIVPIGNEGLVIEEKPAEPGKGTRHRTAQTITDKRVRSRCQQISNASDELSVNRSDRIWSICISADGGITVYTDGKRYPHDDNIGASK